MSPVLPRSQMRQRYNKKRNPQTNNNYEYEILNKILANQIQQYARKNWTPWPSGTHPRNASLTSKNVSVLHIILIE